MKMKERPKKSLEKHDTELMGPQGFWYRLTHDEELRDKLEDRWPFNTFVEILLWIIAVVSVLGFVLDLYNNLRNALIGCP